MIEIYTYDNNSVFSDSSSYSEEPSQITELSLSQDSFVLVNPVEISSRTHDGLTLGDYLATEVYGHVHIDKYDVVYSDLGSETQVEIEIWNPRGEEATVSNLSVVGDIIVSLQNGDTVEPFWHRNLIITIPKEGDIEFEYYVNFTAGGQDFSVKISGNRVYVFPYRPNWANGVTHTYDFLTEVTKSRSGKSGRRSFRVHPRRTLSFSSWVAGKKRESLKAKIDKYVGREMLVPDWAKPMELTSSATSGSYFLPCNTEFSELVEGSAVVLFSSEFLYEVNYVESVSPTGITLSNPLEFDWNYGTIYEGLRCQIDRFSAMRNLTEDLTEFQIDCRFYKSKYPSYSYTNREVLEQEANWTSPPETTVYPVLETLDDKVSKVVRSPFSRQNVKEVSFKATNFGKADILEFERMLRDTRGRYSRFLSRLTDLPAKPVLDRFGNDWLEIPDCSVSERLQRGDRLYVLGYSDRKFLGRDNVSWAEKREGNVERVGTNISDLANSVYVCESTSFSSDTFQMVYRTPEIMECELSLETYSKDSL